MTFKVRGGFKQTLLALHSLVIVLLKFEDHMKILCIVIKVKFLFLIE